MNSKLLPFFIVVAVISRCANDNAIKKIVNPTMIQLQPEHWTRKTNRFWKKMTAFLILIPINSQQML